MPKRTDIEKILIIGSGPIVIGQACEFDYSGSQACRALKAEGYQVVLVNSNPATIMTDPEMADRTYVEPLTPEILRKIIAKERPDALLPTMGGQTALNLAVTLGREGVLEEHGVETIGASLEAIEKAEDRLLFQEAMTRIGLEVPRGLFARSLEEGRAIVEEVGFPVVLRPAYTLGGTGSGVAHGMEEFLGLLDQALDLSLISEVLVEEAIVGWKEYELEVMRDGKGNCVVICSIENLDPMGVHTGDSITVAPAQTLTDREYQVMRDASFAIMEEIGVETGGSNVQFAIQPEMGRMLVIEMNPRVSRSSALASKATGFPIAKMAAKLAIGMTLDEIPNDITRETLASFEPTIDYVVVKVPRWDLAKFPKADPTLGPQMKSVGEAMAIGRTFRQALLKAVRSLELEDEDPLAAIMAEEADRPADEPLHPHPSRLVRICRGLRRGREIESIYQETRIDRWFLWQLADLLEEIEGFRGRLRDPAVLRQAKELGCSDRLLAVLDGETEREVRERREKARILPIFKAVDTCAGEFEAYTPYYYSSYEEEDEVPLPPEGSGRAVLIVGGGPNRIGQGIEFDYCCVQAAFTLRELGYEAVIVNSNPETVSTDYDVSERLYFEPLTLEEVLNVIRRESPLGVILQFGGQTPLKLALELEVLGVPILGTSPESIDLAEDRRRFSRVVAELGLSQPANTQAHSFKEARDSVEALGYPVILRPSYVLGGKAMGVVFDKEDLEEYLLQITVNEAVRHMFPLQIDRFLEDAVELDVDALSDGEEVVIGGILEHIQEAGIHSGDSASVIPPYSIGRSLRGIIAEQTTRLARRLAVRGLLNIQFAVRGDQLFVLEVNPRASRTVPFVSKATGVPLARLATRIMLGEQLRELGLPSEFTPSHISVKEVVLPFAKFRSVDTLLGPEMRSTGEVMGIDTDFGRAYAKAQLGAGQSLPVSGKAFISVRDRDKRAIVFIAKRLGEMGFTVLATSGTAEILRLNGMEVETVLKVHEGEPNVLQAIRSGQVSLVINTPAGKYSQHDDTIIRRTALEESVPCITTISGAAVAVNAIEALRRGDLEVRSLQEWMETGHEVVRPSSLTT